MAGRIGRDPAALSLPSPGRGEPVRLDLEAGEVQVPKVEDAKPRAPVEHPAARRDAPSVERPTDPVERAVGNLDAEPAAALHAARDPEPPLEEAAFDRGRPPVGLPENDAQTFRHAFMIRPALTAPKPSDSAMC